MHSLSNLPFCVFRIFYLKKSWLIRMSVWVCLFRAERKKEKLWLSSWCLHTRGHMLPPLLLYLPGLVHWRCLNHEIFLGFTIFSCSFIFISSHMMVISFQHKDFSSHFSHQLYYFYRGPSRHANTNFLEIFFARALRSLCPKKTFLRVRIFAWFRIDC